MQTEAQLETPKTNIPAQKPGVRCPKCGATRTTRTESTKKYRAYECSSCGYAWQEQKVLQPPSKLKCIAWMIIVVFAYIIGIELLPSLGSLSSTWIETLAVLAVFAVPHELLHALARRFFGYRAIPIPLFFPPILGITIGPQPQKTSEQVAARLAPVLLAAANFAAYCISSNDRYGMLGLLNLFFTAFDILPMILPRRSRRAA